ncbi:hypothetical protein GCM10023322_57690 [Rugosimonospora acidiphila]|uniref:Glycosyltransferase RgtA/B/C/D-like domain-containing protein n=1 Tax=Rugosimonospora acidiphila TaxID=556531 RepID=A0ABP9SE23_9ACTN
MDTTARSVNSTLEIPASVERPPVIHHRAMKRSGLASALLALPAAAVTLAIVLPGLGHRAMWNDEYATWYAATLSAGDLLRLLDHVDAVVAPYYLFMHAWIAVFGDSAASLRMPSALAMAAAAGLTTLLGRRLFNTVVGLAAGLLLACLPAVCRYGQEARPYALVMAATVLAGLLLVRAALWPVWRRWWGYAAAMTAVALLHFVALTALVSHTYFVLRAMRGRRDFRILRWCVPLAVVVTVVLPLAAKGSHESSAIDWISADGKALAQLPGKTFGSGAVAAALLVLAGLGALALWLAGPYAPVFADARDRATAGNGWPDGVRQDGAGSDTAAHELVAWNGASRDKAVMLVCWALFPPVFCYLTFPVLHLLLFRYLLFTLPAYCLLAAAVGHAALGRVRGARWLVPVLTFGLAVAIAFVGVPGQHAARRSPVVGEPDLRAAARVVAAHLRPSDGVAYAGTARNGRRAFAYELRGHPAPRDIFLAVSSQQLGTFGAFECKEPGSCAGETPRIWLVSTAPDSADRFAQMPATTAALLHDEFTAQQEWRLTGVRVSLLVRTGTL